MRFLSGSHLEDRLHSRLRMEKREALGKDMSRVEKLIESVATKSIGIPEAGRPGRREAMAKVRIRSDEHEKEQMAARVPGFSLRTEKWLMTRQVVCKWEQQNSEPDLRSVALEMLGDSPWQIGGHRDLLLRMEAGAKILGAKRHLPRGCAVQ